MAKKNRKSRSRNKRGKRDGTPSTTINMDDTTEAQSEAPSNRSYTLREAGKTLANLKIWSTNHRRFTTCTFFWDAGQHCL